MSLTKLGLGERSGPQENPEDNVIPSGAMRPGTLTGQTQGKNQPPKERITEPLSKEEWRGRETSL